MSGAGPNAPHLRPEELVGALHGRPGEPCWLCGGLGAIAIHNKWSEEAGKTLWVAHRPQSRTHPVRPCPVCTAFCDNRNREQ